MEKLFTHLKEKYNIDQNKVLSVFKTGGSLFCENCKDEDYMVIVDYPETLRFIHRDKSTNTDYIINDKKTREQQLSLEDADTLSLYILNELFKPETTIYGDNTCKFDLFANEEKYLNMLRNVIPTRLISEHLIWDNCELYCNRHLWWAILGLKMLENRSYTITDEMKEIIQKCHDGILEKHYENWVLEKLREGEDD